MTQDTSQILDRLHQVLVEEIREHHSELLERSFTVAEIYQNLAPYRSHRDRIGVDINADYEHALLRLLAGEGEYLELDSETALRQIRQELESLNPDTSMYRDFAAVEVRLNPEMLPEASDAPEDADAREDADVDTVETEFSFVEYAQSGGDDVADRSTGPTTGERASPDSGADEASTSADEGGSAGVDLPEDGACRWCRGDLPDRDDLRFCPHCGSPTNRVPCQECGTELDPEWRFCVACGADAGVA